MSDKIAIIGYSGHGYVVIESALSSGVAVEYYCDMDPLPANPFQLTYLGFEGSSNFPHWVDDTQFILGIGDNKKRSEIGSEIVRRSVSILNIIDSTASMSKFFNMGIGNYIGKNVSVNAFTSIGDFCILNTGCIVEHECALNSGVHIGPGAVLAGNVKVGTNTFIGANSVIKQGITIGSNVIVGAGSVVVKDISDGQMIIGNPGRVYERK